MVAVRSTFENNRSASAFVTGSVEMRSSWRMFGMMTGEQRSTAAAAAVVVTILASPCLSTAGATLRIHLLLVVVQPNDEWNTSQRTLNRMRNFQAAEKNVALISGSAPAPGAPRCLRHCGCPRPPVPTATRFYASGLHASQDKRRTFCLSMSTSMSILELYSAILYKAYLIFFSIALNTLIPSEQNSFKRVPKVTAADSRLPQFNNQQAVSFSFSDRRTPNREGPTADCASSIPRNSQMVQVGWTSMSAGDVGDRSAALDQVQTAQLSLINIEFISYLQFLYNSIKCYISHYCVKFSRHRLKTVVTTYM